jgi:hypothetical protein
MYEIDYQLQLEYQCNSPHNYKGYVLKPRQILDNYNLKTYIITCLLTDNYDDRVIVEIWSRNKVSIYKGFNEINLYDFLEIENFQIVQKKKIMIIISIHNVIIYLEYFLKKAVLFLFIAALNFVY